MIGGRWPSKSTGGYAAPTRRARLPAYAADALQLRASGMVVRLLVVGLDHFNAGREWQTIRGALRVVVPADVADPAAMDWSVAAGLDVLVDHWPVSVDGDGLAARSATLKRRDALLVALAGVPVQSMWLVCDGEAGAYAQRVDVTPGGAVLSGSECATVRTLPAALDSLHDAQLVMGEGIFGSQAAVPARVERLAALFGSEGEGLRRVADALGVDAEIAA